MRIFNTKSNGVFKLNILVGLFIFIISSSVWSAEKFVEINFQGDHTDLYNKYITSNSQYGSFVSGFSGQAFRSSHAGDDGSGTADYTIHFTDDSYWPDTNEIYIKYYYKFELEYTNLSSNVKWLWTYGSDAHNEIICSSVSPTAVNLRWQLNGGGSEWSSDVTKYGSISVVQGTWMKVEIYFKLSSGPTCLNTDGVQWIKINDKYVISQTNVRTGKPGRMSCTAINATSNQPSGHGWWQIDQLEIWDGLPGGSGGGSFPGVGNTLEVVKVK